MIGVPSELDRPAGAGSDLSMLTGQVAPWGGETGQK
jgi:hypothetical protein